MTVAELLDGILRNDEDQIMLTSDHIKKIASDHKKNRIASLRLHPKVDPQRISIGSDPKVSGLVSLKQEYPFTFGPKHMPKLKEVVEKVRIKPKTAKKRK